MTERAILRYSDGGFETVKEDLYNISLSACMYNGNVVLVHGKQTSIISPTGDVKQTIALRAEATSMTISENNQTLAFGFVDGFVEVNKLNNSTFESVQKQGTRGSNPLVMHKDAAVTSLTILRYEDNREWMLSFGEDRKAMQAHTDELIASARASTGLHQGLVKSITTSLLTFQKESVQKCTQPSFHKRNNAKICYKNSFAQFKPSNCRNVYFASRVYSQMAMHHLFFFISIQSQ